MNNKLIFSFAILALAMCASATFNVVQFQKSREDKNRIDLLSQNTGSGQAKIVERYVHDSIEHVVIKEVAVRTQSEKAIAVGSGYLDTLTTALKIAAKQVDEVTKVNATLAIENLQLRQDLTYQSKQEYSDRWLHLIYDRDSNRASLTYDPSLNIVKYWRRSWLFGPKRYYNDIFSDDPRVKINSVKRFTLADPRQKRFGVGFSGGYGYMPSKNVWGYMVAATANYNLKAF